jgi:signal peptidase II
MDCRGPVVSDPSADAPDPVTLRAILRRRLVLFAALAALGTAVDLLTKRWIFGRLGMPHQSESVWLVDQIFGFTTSLNEGALFGIGQGQGLIFCTLSLVAAGGIAYWLFVAGAAHDLLLTIALALVTGGIFGNLYDRLGLPGLTWGPDSGHPPGERVYAVRDWLHFQVESFQWPIFNIADSLLVCGAALLVWHALVGEAKAREHGRSA